MCGFCAAAHACPPSGSFPSTACARPSTRRGRTQEVGLIGARSSTGSVPGAGAGDLERGGSVSPASVRADLVARRSRRFSPGADTARWRWPECAMPAARAGRKRCRTRRSSPRGVLARSGSSRSSCIPARTSGVPREEEVGNRAVHRNLPGARSRGRARGRPDGRRDGVLSPSSQAVHTAAVGFDGAGGELKSREKAWAPSSARPQRAVSASPHGTRSCRVPRPIRPEGGRRLRAARPESSTLHAGVSRGAGVGCLPEKGAGVSPLGGDRRGLRKDALRAATRLPKVGSHPPRPAPSRSGAGPSKSHRKMDCQVPRTNRPASTNTTTLDPTSWI